MYADFYIRSIWPRGFGHFCTWFSAFAWLPLGGWPGLLCAESAANSGCIPEKIKALSKELQHVRGENTIMELIVNNANDGILIQDLEGRIEWSNPAYSRITGFSAEEIRGKKPQEFVIPPESRPSPKEIEEFRYDVSSGHLEDFESILNVRKNGELFWNQLSFAVATFEEGEEPKVIIIAREITEQREHEEELKRSEVRNKELAEFDSLTGLPNRMKLSKHLETVVANSMESGKTAGLLHIDLDQFKAINDTLGHSVGDKVLVHAADQMTSIVVEMGMVGRFGGDEFWWFLRKHSASNR